MPIEDQHERDGIGKNEKKRHVVAFCGGLEIALIRDKESARMKCRK